MAVPNELAVQIAEKINAIPVITTATDLQNKFAVDLFAKRNGLRIINKDGIAKISAKVLAGEKVTLCVEEGHLKEGTKIPEEIHLISYPSTAVLSADSAPQPSTLCAGKSKTGASDKHRRIAPITAQRVCRRNGM